jgi:predicted Zn-dependent peptidase
LEAETAKEYACYSVVVPPRELDTALEILAELLSQPALEEGGFWGEKLVVVQEVRRAQDQVGILMDLFAETLWHHHPLRHPVLGTLEGLRDVEYGDLLAFYRQRYVTGNMLLVVCGDLDARQVTQAATVHFAGLPTGGEQRPAPVAELPLDGCRTSHLSRELGQTQLLIGVPTVSMAHDDRSPLKVAERVLGMGGSARLYQRLREEKRLVYSVQTVTAQYEDVGYFAVRTACDPQRLAEVQQAILDEWVRLCDEGVSDAELRAAQSNYAGTLARRFETNLAVAGIHGVEGLLHKVEPFEEATDRINAVRAEDVRRVARQYLDPERYVAVTVGRRDEGTSPEGPQT